MVSCLLGVLSCGSFLLILKHVDPTLHCCLRAAATFHGVAFACNSWVVSHALTMLSVSHPLLSAV